MSTSRAARSRSPPEPAVDEDAEGLINLESGEDRIVLKFHLRGLARKTVYSIVTSDNGSSEQFAMTTKNPAGNSNFKVDTEAGDPLPLGSSSVDDLVGLGISVLDPDGNVVLEGTICEPKELEEEDGDGDGGASDDLSRFQMTTAFDTFFLRGNANDDDAIDIADSVFTLKYLFVGEKRPRCLDAPDTNDDGRLDLTDPVYLLRHLFQGGARPSYPGTLIAGADPTADDLFCIE